MRAHETMKTFLRSSAAALALSLPAAALAAEEGEAAPADAPAAAVGGAAPAPAAAGEVKESGYVGISTDKLGQFEEVPDYVTSEHLQLHTVQRKEVADGGRHEFVLYPLAAQMNTKFTTHLGVAGQYAYHVHENFAFQVQGEYFYVNEQTGFTDELINNGKQAPQAATALTLQWAATGGFEVTPIYGKFAFYEGFISHFGLVLSGGAGVAGTRIQIQGESSAVGKATFGDTGQKFVGQVGAGFRVFLTEHLLMRIEVKDLVYTAKVDSINGCDATDLNQLKNNQPAQNASCANGEFESDSDFPIAQRLVEEPSSDVLNNVGIYAGVAYAF